MEREAVVTEFTGQSEAFNAAAAMRSADTLGRLIELAAPAAGERWIDVACGPGLVARALAPRAGEVHGVDMTPAMIDLARREAEREGLPNITFAVGDATALAFRAATFDAAVTRFALHHIPLPGRVLEELRRVVRPGGTVVVGDHVTTDDPDTAAWHEEIERLRDPSHWACLTPARIRALGVRAGLALEDERDIGLTIDYEEWIGRGSGGERSRALIERSLAERRPPPDVFAVSDPAAGPRTMGLRYCLTRWRVA